MGRPTKRLLTRDQIASTALELLDEGGPAGLGMRPLAARLGVSAPSLYHHVSGMDEVVELVHDLADSEIDLETLEDEDWRRGVERFARSYRRVYLDHPHVLAVVARKPLLATNALRTYDSLAAALARAGLPAADTMRTMAELDYLVLGSSFDDFVGGFPGFPASYAREFPHLAGALRATRRATVNEGAFEASLAALLDQIATRLATPPKR
jgi:AcrR family transcriptional regulator